MWWNAEDVEKVRQRRRDNGSDKEDVHTDLKTGSEIVREMVMN